MISVVMATRNGEKVLPLTLESLCQVAIPDGGVEFVIVDNGSDDRTARVLDEFRPRLPMQILSEPTPGRAPALNAGIRKAAGDLIVITDDDVMPDRAWLQAYAKAAADHEDVGLFAGQVRHHWQKSPPRWLERLAEEGLSYGGTSLEQPEGPISPNLIKGANFAVRRHLFDDYQISEDLGYGAHGDMVPGDESDFARRAVEDGHSIWFLPDAKLRHIVRPHEVAVWPVLRRYFRIGRGAAALDPGVFDKGLPRLFGYPRYLFRTVPVEIGKALKHALGGDLYSCMKTMIFVAMTVGQAYQWRMNQCATKS